jgi:hypothetical protein
MPLAHATPRPASYSYQTVGQALADRDVDLTNLEACRIAMVEAFGVEPDVDWLSARNLASDLRQERRVEASARAVVRHTCIVGLAGLFLIVGANVAFAAATGITPAEWEVVRALLAGGAGVAVVAAAAWWIERFLAARISDGEAE